MYDSRYMSAAPAEPSLPRLTRLGAPTSPVAPQHPPLPGYFDSARPPQLALDTHLPPLPLPQPGFIKKSGAPISPSVYSNSSSTFSRRRSSDESEDGRPPSSISSTSGHSGYGMFRHVPWGAAPPADQSRKGSASSEYAFSPKQSQPVSQMSPRQYGAQLPRVPVGGHPAQRPQVPLPPQNPYMRLPPPPQNPHAQTRAFLRSDSYDDSFGQPSPEMQTPTFRSARNESPRPPMQRAPSPLAGLREGVPAPPPLRTSKSHITLSSSLGAPGPAFAGARRGHTSSIYTPVGGSNITPPLGSGRFTPPMRQHTPQLPMPPSPPSRPMSVTDLPISEMEIDALWSHACLLYHHGKPADAVTMLHAMHQRPGLAPVTLARLNINIGIVSESLSSNRNNAGVAPKQTTQLMIEAFQSAVKHSPDGPEGALATFLLGCALFDNEDFSKAASCFDMCEAVFAGEHETMNFRMSANQPWSATSSNTSLDGGEKIDLRRLGMEYTLYLSMVRENYHVAQERSRIPAFLGTSRGLQHIPSGLLVEYPMPMPDPSLSPLAESEEDEEREQSSPSIRDTVLPDIRLDIGPPEMSAPPPLRRRTTKKDREEMERRREARRTRILIKLGDLRLNKPLPPLPHEREAMNSRGSGRQPSTPQVPPLPVAKVWGGMAFV